jgi:hypothetical protein
MSSRRAGPGAGGSVRCIAVAAATCAMLAAACAAAAATAVTADDRAGWKPTFTSVDHAPISGADIKHATSMHRTIPMWETTVTSPVDGNTYSYNMAGRTPYASRPARGFIRYIPLAIRLHFPDGTVLDASKPSACDTQPIMSRFYESPLFKKSTFISNGVDVSGRHGEQLESAFQRANFWSVAQGTNFGVELVPAATPRVVDVTAPADAKVVTFPIQCPSGATVTIKLGLIKIGEYNNLVESTIAPLASSVEVPMFLTYNVVETAGGGCCIIGYHNAVKVTDGIQVYAVGTYNDPGVFINGNGQPIPLEDIYAWSHELGELIDDPFVQNHTVDGRKNNLTPAWGGTGQVGGCQNNLEVGDPLTGVAFYTIARGGFLYHYQDLAFHDWFYRTPSTGTGGLYSFKGNFTTDAGPVCGG